MKEKIVLIPDNVDVVEFIREWVASQGITSIIPCKFLTPTYDSNPYVSRVMFKQGDNIYPFIVDLFNYALYGYKFGSDEIIRQLA